ncbi:Oidioi.mRNA.OKI2018_I69.chr2.g6946.t1.cds [Oikopleura dioica]|uniref:Oidioi.mRNA.OKI2018_I69.chr2.g6946.t1.cds n=1 Tax=Oikopleura dioica TaxID=34765 RepID=A0ABN7TB64_OIKDI|nr:Oidioi.mRNA.OKI2018_I69.chr2.g6946.t1.cds [Oikopleura dioica]
MSKILDLFVANPQWLLGQDKEDEEEQLKDILKKATPKLKSVVKTGQEQQQYFFKFNQTGFLKTNLQGLPAGFLVEVSGEAGAGKTCFALETAAAALLNDEKSHVLFISSEGKFPAERLLQIIGNDCNSYSDRVLVEETEYLENFLTLVQKLPNVCKKYEDSGHKIACIIVDSITALMRLEYEAKDSMARGDMLDSLCSDLKEIATRFKLPVLFINQVSENIDEPMIHWAHRPMSKKPSLGITWRYLMDECIFLSIEKNEKEEKERVLEVTKSQRIKTVPLKFKITKNGFEEACLINCNEYLFSMDSAGVRKNLNGVHPRIPISYDLYKQLKTEASSEMQEGNISCSKFTPLPSTVGKCRLAFMGRSSNPGASPDPNLMFVDVDPLLRNVDLSNWSDLIKPLRIDDRKKQRSVQHDLLLERKRQSPSKGVNDFSFTGNRLLMQGGKSSIFYADIGEIPKFVTHEVPALDNAAPRMDPKLCPGDVNYMAFYRNGNLWLQNIEKVGEIVQLTNAGQENIDFKGVYAGWVNYLIQEEFDRYSGYYWQDTASRTQRIVYEVSDESELETLTYVNHVAVAQQICAAGGASSGNARSAASSEAVFPSSGSKNPKTDIRFLTVSLPDNETDKVTVRRFKLPIPLMEYLPWSETEKQGYVVRYGWIGDNGIWAHVLTRLQNKSAIVFIPINSFVDEESELPDNFINQHPVFILHQWTSETWIKETDSIHFLI